MQTKKSNLYSFTTNCASVCYDCFKEKWLMRNYRFSECFSPLKKFLFDCHDDNYTVCQTATTSVGSEFSLCSSQFILCAIQITSIIVLQNFDVPDFSLHETWTIYAV